MQLIERFHQRIPNLCAILRFGRHADVIQFIPHIFQRFIGFHAFKQLENCLYRIIRRLCAAQIFLQRKQRCGNLLAAFFQRIQFFLCHTARITKRSFECVAAHVRAFAISAELVGFLLRNAQKARLRTFQYIVQPPAV